MLFLALLSDVKNLQQQLFMNIVIKKIRKNTKINLTWFDNILVFTGYLYLQDQGVLFSRLYNTYL